MEGDILLVLATVQDTLAAVAIPARAPDRLGLGPPPGTLLRAFPFFLKNHINVGQKVISMDVPLGMA